MTDLLNRKLLYLLHRALVDVRNLSMAGHAEQVTDLADLFEWLPSQMACGCPTDVNDFFTDLKAYQDKYGEHAYDYLRILSMEDEEFYRTYDSW